MAKKPQKFNEKNVSIELRGNGLEILDDILSKVAPNAKKTIESKFNEILNHAKSNWPVRKPLRDPESQSEEGKIRSAANQMKEDRKDWSFKQALAVAHYYSDEGKLRAVTPKAEKSKGSKDKLYIETKINSKDEIEFVIGNSAEYAWAIKIGGDSDSSLPYGARVANELLWKPTKKAADAVAEALAKDLK